MPIGTYTETTTGCVITNDRGEALELNVEQEQAYWSYAAQHSSGEADDADTVQVISGGIASGTSH